VPIVPIAGIGQVAGAAPSPPAAPGSAGGTDFGGALENAVGKLASTQQQADTAAQSLATGTATDVSSVVAEVERASLSLQLAVQIRNKAVDAYNELFRMQV
jgi:flagellar hook-basal body complex protein FliE